MTDKALISELSRIPLAEQKAAYPDMPHFTAPDDIPTLLRPSTRKGMLHVHVVSEAVIADNEKDYREFLGLMRKRGAWLCVKGGLRTRWTATADASMVLRWRAARRNGASRAGGEAMSVKSEKEFWTRFAKIVDRWHLPSKGANANKPLLAEAKIGSRATVKRYLGYTREEWQRMPETKRQRLARKAKAA